MARISHDGQSFSLDGRHIWLVSGSIHYPRLPHQLWRDRIRAAKQAGLNCISTYVFWNVHEPQPRSFCFEGDADLRHFVQLVGEEGMYCILRPGPYIGAEWDFGGLPAWLERTGVIKLRQADPAFLEASARYLGQVMQQVHDLQVTSASGGPIIMMQAENQWLCYNPQQGEKYLRHIVRYLRENGCQVPISVCNNLWQRTEGALDTWNARDHLAADLRQLQTVASDAPRIVAEYRPGWFDSWGQAHDDGFDANTNLNRLAQILGAGSQYNIYMFYGGTNFGFFGGRSTARRDQFLTTSYDYGAPLGEAGWRGEKYRSIKRISTFATQFGHVFANLMPDYHPVAIDPTQQGHATTVLHQTGSQGDIVIIIQGEMDQSNHVPLLLSNGLSLQVPMDDDKVAWLLLHTNLGSVELTYTNLRPWAFIEDRMLVVFGPEGTEGAIGIDDATLNVKVPHRDAPLVDMLQEITVVVLNCQQVDTAYIVSGGLIVGAAGLDEHDEPIPDPQCKTCLRIELDGNTQTLTMPHSRLRPRNRQRAPKLTQWQQVSLAPFITGEAVDYQTIDGPASLEALQCDYGYGWYRFSAKTDPEVASMAPLSGDRLHVFHESRRVALLGLGAGADYDPMLLKLDGVTTVLADNLGRFNFGWSMGAPGEYKGLASHFYAVKAVPLAKPKVVAGPCPDPFTLAGYFTHLRNDRPQLARHIEPPPRRMTDALLWKFKPVGRKPVVLDIVNLPLRVMIVINRTPLAMYDPHLSAGLGRYMLQVGTTITGGQNELRLELLGDDDSRIDVLKYVKLYQCTQIVSGRSKWAFAPWTVPQSREFGPIVTTDSDLPSWYRSTFKATHTDVPLWLEPRGMTKGQIYLNGHNVGRYFVATASGKTVPPQKKYYLPEPWLHTDKSNELLLFEEHDRAPNRCALKYDSKGPYGK